MAEPIVTIEQGQIKGKEDSDIDGGKFYKFLGVPYAKPPLGSLRFKAPQQADSWNDVRDCTRDGVDVGCLCFENKAKVYMGSEDCLYINVFTKELPKPKSHPKHVMVFIHGGGFVMGSGSIGGPKHLLTEDIVLVTFSYRTGVFGFLSADDQSLDIPGNAGLKDQTHALKWVQKNIAKFNGDKNNVTLFGISAGGMSASLHIVSKASKGLFHKVIVQSGTALSPGAWGQKNSIQLAEKLGQKVSTEDEALGILMNVPAQELLTAALKIPDTMFQLNERRPFGPVIENHNPTEFLTENPIDLLTSGKYNQVPIIQGMVSNEGMVYESTSMGPTPTVTPECGLLWYLDIQGEKSLQITESIRNFYFNNGMTKDAIYKFVGDIIFMHGTIESTKLIARTSSHPVYLYVYSREVGLSRALTMLHGNQDETIRGVPHGGDQIVLLNHSFIALLGIKMDEENTDAVKQLVKIWTDFARSGTPHKKWQPVKSENNLTYLDIDKDLTLKTDPFQERFSFWDKIFKESSGVNLKLKEKPKSC